mgnify:CR=1 FL=1
MSIDVNKGVERRTVLKGAAWSVPVIAVAAATPFAAAATGAPEQVNGFQVDGSCGLGNLGLLGPGFTVTAGTSPIPQGTQIIIDSASVISADLIGLGANESLADVTILNGNAIVTLSSELPATETLEIKWLLSVTLDLGTVGTTATLNLPSGYTAGSGTKSTGTLSQTLVLCNAG